jgi:hypothetical protein
VVKALVDASSVLTDLILRKLIGDVAPQGLVRHSLQAVAEVVGEANVMRCDMCDLWLNLR